MKCTLCSLPHSASICNIKFYIKQMQIWMQNLLNSARWKSFLPCGYHEVTGARLCGHSQSFNFLSRPNTWTQLAFLYKNMNLLSELMHWSVCSIFSRTLHGGWMHMAIYFHCRKTVHFCITNNGLCSLFKVSQPLSMILTNCFYTCMMEQILPNLCNFKLTQFQTYLFLKTVQ